MPPETKATSGLQRADKRLANLLPRAKINDFRFHDLRHTFASWYMICGGDLYELSKFLEHSNIRITERYAELARKHIIKTGAVSAQIRINTQPLQTTGEEVEREKGHIT